MPNQPSDRAADAEGHRAAGADGPRAAGAGDTLDDRYGRRPRTAGRPWYRRPLPLAGAVLGAVLVLGYGLWVSVAQSSGPAFTEIGHSIIDDRTAEVRFEVTRDEGQAVRCTVHGLDEGNAEVGVTSVDVPAAGPRSVQETVQVRTTARAVTVQVKACVPLER